MAASHDPITIAAAAMTLVFRAQGGDRVEEDIPALPVRRPEFHQTMRTMPRPSSRTGDRDRVGPSRLSERPTGRLDREQPNTGMVRVYVGTGRHAGIRSGISSARSPTGEGPLHGPRRHRNPRSLFSHQGTGGDGLHDHRLVETSKHQRP